MSSLDFYDTALSGTVCRKNDKILVETASNQHACAEKCNANKDCIGFTHTNTNNDHKCNLFKDVNNCRQFDTLKWNEWGEYTHVHWYARNTDFYKKVKTVGPTPLETCRNEKSTIQIELDRITKEKSLLFSENTLLQTEIEETKSAVDMLKKQNFTMETDFQRITGQNSELYTEMKKMKESNSKMQKNQTSLESDLKDLENQAQKDTFELDNLRSQNIDIENELFVLKTQIKNLEGELKVAHDENLRCEDQNVKMKLDHVDLNNKVTDLLQIEDNLEKEIVSLETEKDAWERHKIEFNNTYDILAQENMQLRESCSNNTALADKEARG